MERKNFISKYSLIVLLVALFLGGTLIIANSQTLKLGDVNASGTIDIVDALLIAQYSAGLNPTMNTSLADVNCDGKVDINDALIVVRHSAGILPAISCSPTPTPTITVTPTCSPCVVTVEGNVTDALTSLPISGVAINMRTLDYGGSVNGGTDVNGYYRMTSPTCRSSEHVRIQATKAGYTIFVLETTLACSRTNTIPIVMIPESPTMTPSPTPTPTPTPSCSPCEMTITGTVTRSDSGQPLPGAIVSMMSGSSGVTTDANGNYSLTIKGMKPDGRYCPIADFFLYVRMPGFTDGQSGIIGFTCSSNYPQNFRLNPLPSPAPAY